MLDSESKKRLIEQTKVDRIRRKRSEHGSTDALAHELVETENIYRTLVENTGEGIVVAQDGMLRFANPRFADVAGYSAEELLSRPFIEFVHPDDRERVMEIHLKRLKSEQVPTAYEFRIVDKLGNTKWLENSGILIDWGGRPAAMGFLRDITERKLAEERQRLVARVLALLNQPGEEIDIIHGILLAVKESTGLEAVGIRLRQGDDFPYYETTGFSAEFVEAENHLCEGRLDGQPLRDSEGRPRLECMCGNIIRGRTDSSLPFFTEGGSFWTNSTTALLASLSEKERQCCTRNTCNSAGYESVALIPLHAGDETIGLLQLNDTRKDMFTLETTSFFEEIGASIGISFKRKQAEEALAESEQRFRRLSEAAFEGIAFSENGVLVDANEAFVGMYLCSLEELVGKPVMELVAPEHRELVAEKIRSGYEEVYECKGIRKDGSLIDLEIHGRPVTRQGRKMRMTAIRDITERKKAEVELQESEERLKILFEYAPDGIYLNDLNGNLVDGNKAAEELAGYAREELIGKNFAEAGLLSPQDTEKAVARLRKTAAGEPVGPEEFTIRRKDGSEVAAEISTFPATIKGQTFSLGVARDITDRKRAEAALANEKLLSEEYINSLPGLFYVFNEQRFVRWNSVWETVTGYSAEELGSKYGTDFFEGEDRTLIRERMRKVFSEGAADAEAELVTKDGRRIPYYFTGLRKEFDGKPHLVGLGIDITERKRARLRLLEYSQQLKSLASRLSLAEERERHRLATELHDHIGQSLVFSKLKLDELRKSASTQELTEALQEVCDTIGQVIADARTLTFDLSSPILYELGFEAAVAEWLKDEIEKRHGIKTEFKDDRQPKPLDDDIRPVLFRNVRELLVNVVKHAQARKVKVSLCRVDGNMRVSVEDDGKGFDPVEVASMAAKRAEFGLFSIRERLTQLGGSIDIASRPGQGTRILMTAPLKQTETKNTPQTV